MKNNKLTNLFSGLFFAIIFSANMISCASTKNVSAADGAPVEPESKKYVMTYEDDYSQNLFTFTINPDNTYNLHMDKLIFTANYFNPNWTFPILYINIDFEQGTIKGNPDKKKKIQCDFQKYVVYNSSRMIETLLQKEFPELLNNELTIEEIKAYISPYLKNTGASQKDIDQITLATSHGFYFLAVLQKLVEQGRFEYELNNSDLPLEDYNYAQRKVPVSNKGKDLLIQSFNDEFGAQIFKLVEQQN